MSRPKIVFFDIETSPNVVLSWRIGRNLTLGTQNLVEERKIICVSWKYQGHKKVHNVHWGKAKCDKRILTKLTEVLNTCDLAIGHNGDRFDLPWLKGRAMMLGMPPINGVSTIDTLKLSRRNFNLNSNKLDYLGEIVSGKGKLTTGFQLWKDVMAGDKKALAHMCAYCDEDVRLLERVYDYILPYVETPTKHLGLINGGSRDGCPKCGSMKKQKYGKYYTASNVFQKYKCGNHHIYRSRTCMKRGD